MLKYNIERILKLKAIEKQVGYLTRMGFNKNTASSLINGKKKTISLPQIEKLCLSLKCTPNDLFEWIPDNGSQEKNDNPLFSLKRDMPKDISKIAQRMKLEDLEELMKKIES